MTTRYDKSTGVKQCAAGTLTIDFSSPRGNFKLDYFMDATSHLNANTVDYFNTRADYDIDVLNEHQNMLNSSPVQKMVLIPGTQRFFIGSPYEIGTLIAEGTRADPNFGLGDLPEFAAFEDSFSDFLTGGRIDLSKFLSMGFPAPRDLTPLFASGEIDGTSIPFDWTSVVSARPGGATPDLWIIGQYVTPPSPRFPQAGVGCEAGQLYATSYKNLNHMLAATLTDGHTAVLSGTSSGASHRCPMTPGYLGPPETPVYSEWKSVLGVYAITALATAKYPDTAAEVCIITWPGFEDLGDFYEEKYGVTHLGSLAVGGDPSYLEDQTYNTRIAGLDSFKAIMGDKLAGTWATLPANIWYDEMTLVGRPFGSYNGLLIGSTENSSMDVYGVDRQLSLTKGTFMYNVTFAQLARGIDLTIAKTVDPETSANLVIASDKLKLHPDYVLCAVEFSEYLNILNNGLTLTELWTECAAAGINLGTQVVGTETVNTVITRLNGLVRDSSFSIVQTDILTEPVTDDILTALNNPLNYTIRVSGDVGSFVFTLRDFSGPILPVPTWWDNKMAKVLVDSGTPLDTVTGADLVAAEAELDSYVGDVYSVGDRKFLFSSADFIGAGYPLVEKGMTADGLARAIFHTKGLEQPALKAQLRVMIGALRP